MHTRVGKSFNLQARDVTITRTLWRLLTCILDGDGLLLYITTLLALWGSVAIFSNTVFVRLHAHFAWTINQEKPEITPSSISQPKRWRVKSGGDWRYYTWARQLKIQSEVLENVISETFWANISKILLELLWKMLRFAVYMGCDRYKRLISCLLLAFSLTNANFTHYGSLPTGQFDIPKLCLKTSQWHWTRSMHLFEHVQVNEQIWYIATCKHASIFSVVLGLMLIR